MTKDESDLIITEQNKSTEEILKAVAKVKSDYRELCNLKDMRIAELEAQIEKMKNKNKESDAVLAAGSTFNKALNSMNKALEEERDKYRNMVFDKDEQLTEAKNLIRNLLRVTWGEGWNYSLDWKVKAEQFLNEVEK